MRIAALYDIRGNLPALEGALHACRIAGADAVVLGGALASGPLPLQTLNIVMALGRWAIPVRSAADRAVVECYDRLMEDSHDPCDGFDPLDRWAAGRITGAQRDYLANLREHAVLSAEEIGEIYFGHQGVGTESTDDATAGPDLEELLAKVSQPTLVVGSGPQFSREIGGRRIVGAGSVGMARAGPPGAYWVLLGPEIAMQRTDYVNRRSLWRLRRSGMPGAREFTESVAQRAQPQ